MKSSKSNRPSSLVGRETDGAPSGCSSRDWSDRICRARGQSGRAGERAWRITATTRTGSPGGLSKNHMAAEVRSEEETDILERYDKISQAKLKRCA
jgi:hypothetical protein